MKDITGFEGRYAITKDGRIWSHIRHVWMKSNGVNNSGYHIIRLRKSGTSKGFLIHRLVAMTFIPNPLGKQQVNHKDGDKHNNSSRNIEWSTSRENILHGIGLGLMNDMRGENNHMAVFSEEKVRLIKSMYRKGIRQVDILHKLGIVVTPSKRSYIYAIINGKRWKYIS